MKILKSFTVLFTIVAVVSNLYIFTYPSFNSTQCSWRGQIDGNDVRIEQEMDIVQILTLHIKSYLSDLFNLNEKKNSASESKEVHMLAFGDPQIRGPWKKTNFLKRLDIYGNDYYLGHIVSKMVGRLKPEFVTVVGDLFSSQWINDSEFYRRTVRYATNIFNRDINSITEIRKNNLDENGDYKCNWESWGQEYHRKLESNLTIDDYRYENVYTWDKTKDNYLFINLTGNHDIGYSGDTTYQHLARFATFFGKDNYWIEYETETDHPWRIVVLNSMLLEGPALQPDFVKSSWKFLNLLSSSNFNGSTVLLTHIPMYKEQGICHDGPEFKYYPKKYKREPYKAKLLRSQNHLSYNVTQSVLNSIFNNDKPGIILTGHDHEGCKTTYNKVVTPDGIYWEPVNSSDVLDHHIQEITVRSMMGYFGGNTGILTGLFNDMTSQWEWHFSLCPFASEHIWWVANVSIALSIILWTSMLI
ncbi:hypothetical protein Kpol_1070p23 [Vanderwaltozyma polyspora DSM 70294]|uniref:Uncharacterized protein n=1 Tax=Vanderwaltozyma polyspora (strain ATCC 22028 / DSM 70294 / BCRC 21397 / CBS 2163 / NBRC 10782 / NRRL Y-8283 / UCD 57-17) TaxID=436907 RepID=A7TNM3_VANPO|nr:uncharacterized protein Kpol_1070p23 [Vanderwaltozyma polyspora DSM 70294]EDO16140.1 hypothetical protein Kpol_1070p23 [Vanderwaltozyma polyspora DSM 70294]